MKECWTRILSTIFMAAVAAGIYCGTTKPEKHMQKSEITIKTIVKK